MKTRAGANISKKFLRSLLRFSIAAQLQSSDAEFGTPLLNGRYRNKTMLKPFIISLAFLRPKHYEKTKSEPYDGK
jgi:hypothetical protein